jgi:hypothetical protein
MHELGYEQTTSGERNQAREASPRQHLDSGWMKEPASVVTWPRPDFCGLVASQTAWAKEQRKTEKLVVPPLPIMDPANPSGSATR